MAVVTPERNPELYVESWAQSYGTPYQIDEDDDVAADVEVVEGEFALIDGVAPPQTGRLAFVDGTRRGEASLYRFVEDRLVRGITGAYATGAVVQDDARGRSAFAEVAVERCIVWGSGSVAPLPERPGNWTWHHLSTASDDPAAPLAELQSRMRVAEGRTAERLAASGYLVVADGPLNFSLRLDGIVGYVKRHQKPYLPAELHARVGELRCAQRTSIFRIGTERFSCYSRLVDRGRGGPWEGVVRLEIPAEGGLAAATATATTLAALLPRFAGLPHCDPRAPQNLQPIGALEKHLRQHLGAERLADRAVRDAVAAMTRDAAPTRVVA